MEIPSTRDEDLGDIFARTMQVADREVSSYLVGLYKLNPGLYKLNPVYPQLESAWFPTLAPIK